MFKTYNTQHSCQNLPAGSRQAARGARICETGLFGLKADDCFNIRRLVYDLLSHIFLIGRERAEIDIKGTIVRACNPNSGPTAIIDQFCSKEI